jgi:hypothetical protein
MGISTANSTGQDDRLNNLLTCLERAEKAHGGRRRAGIEKDGRLSALCRDFPLAGAPNNVGSRKGDDQRQPTTLQPGIPDDVDLERIRTAIHGLHDEHHVSHLPRATQLPPIPGLAPVGSHRAVPTRVSIDLDKLIPTPTWRRPGRTFSAGTAFLVAGTIAAAWASYFVFTSWPPAMDFAEAPSLASSETRLVPLSPLPQAVLPSTRLQGLTAVSEAAPEPQLAMLSDDKPTENGIEARSPRTLPPTEYKATTGETRAMPGSNSVHQTSPRSGADALLDGQDTKPLIERERLVYPASVQVSTCFPSASAVRQEYPEAWPSWTLRAAGHEGTKCWHAVAHATAHDHRGEAIAKKETVGTMEKLGTSGETK